MALSADEKLKRLIRNFPKVYKAGENPVLTAMLRAIATSDSNISTQIDNTKAQLFVRTAEGKNLDRLANSLGVSRPSELGLDDPTFQELIPNLSLKPKQIRKAFYDTGDVFWGPLFSRANVTTTNAATYNLSAGDEINVKINEGEIQTIKILTGDIVTPGAATAEEVQTILSRIKGASVEIITDQLTSNKKINVRTNTPGPLGAVTFYTSSGIGSSKLDFPLTKIELNQQAQRYQIYQINYNEVIIEIPAIVPALRRVLKGSHHFHNDSTLESPIAPANGIWQGSFFFDPNGVEKSFTITGQNAKLDSGLIKNNIYTSIIVNDTSKIEESTGNLVFGWGTEREEQPVRYRGVPNSKTILIDPSYIFQFDHPVNEYVNVVADSKAFVPSKDGTDLPIYMTSPAGARAKVEEIIRTLAAAGIVITFVILAPEYKYLQDNPYISSDDAPGSN